MIKFDHRIGQLLRFLMLLLCTSSLMWHSEAVVGADTPSVEKPNIVFILADDLGYGDVHCFNPTRCKIATPNIDRLAEQGMMFTDAHTSSSVCTPTRYGILTGRYNWRTQLQKGVLHGFDAPLIAEDRLTVAGYLKQHGYTTAGIGKWHLGMDLPRIDDTPVKGNNPQNIDWDSQIHNGPVTRGFDYFFGISASLDMPPYIYIENDRFVGRGTATKAFNRKGPAEPDFEAIDVLPMIGRKAVEFIKRQKDSTPFFAYVPFTSPHTPILPSKDWQGKSVLGKYGDFVMQTDAVVGEIVNAIDQAGLSENTIVIMTSDNGCSKAAGIKDLQSKGHFPSAHFRGSKADLWDGGHRVPFIVRWPSKVKPGTSSDQLICQIDLMATCAQLMGSELPNGAGEDSVSFLSALSGKKIDSTRAGVIHHSIGGYFAYRQGKWKLLLAKGSGGWTSPRENEVADDAPIAQLYDMEIDPHETNNLYTSEPAVAKRLLAQLESDVNRGRSTDGPAARNDVEDIVIEKGKH
ncbi:sulfatase family protein [Novipirellula artificiosorum]|uniref:Arylsulfatase n=1 Tax=Novipirellula artificiosorum TaxID=2528016 RepID=A0A5C6DJF1_9BACT|nr:arylsulfatase [Novipirellula artificiosorum]TWU35036.1 Arylsulfatase [Novipirellula artificiosorum]